MRTTTTVMALVALAACGVDPDSSSTVQASHGHGNGHGHDDCDWTQWGGGAAHAGASCEVAQPLEAELGHVTLDPFVDEAMAEIGEYVLVHYQVPMILGNDVYALTKTGEYISCDPPGSFEPFPCGPDAMGSQIWTESAYRWHGNHLVKRWSFDSDWKPSPGQFIEPMFQPAASDKYLYVPGAEGSVYRLDRNNGHVKAHYSPFGPDAYVWGGVTVDANDTIYYNVVELDPADPFADPTASWLVKINKHGQVAKVSYASVNPAAPAPDDLCYSGFGFQVPRPPRPWPPPPNPDGSPALPPQLPCGVQRPGLNITPAISPDGTIFTASYGPFTGAYLIALRPNLTLKWARLLDGLNDGCGVLTTTCRPGATVGVDPNTNLPPIATISDQGWSSPVALPDGGVVFGAYTGYNGGRGHTFKFTANGTFAGTFDFGWDLTPAIYRHDGTYSIVLKNNDYVNEVFLITQLSADLDIEWSYQATNPLNCAREDDGTITCVDDGTHPNGYEWCMNAPAVDDDGTVYGTSEDGNLYAIAQGGVEIGRFFLDHTRLASYTPTAIDREGRVYGLNNGELSIVGADNTCSDDD